MGSRLQFGSKCYYGEIAHMETFVDENRATGRLNDLRLDTSDMTVDVQDGE